MKIDLYTKLVLTVIAICLTIICFRDLDIVSPAYAQYVGSSKETLDVRIVSCEDDLPVKINAIKFPMMNSLPVEINNVKYGILNSLPVNSK